MDLVVVLDDATSEVYQSRFVPEENIRICLEQLKAMVQQKGVFCALYTDKGSHFQAAIASQSNLSKANFPATGREAKITCTRRREKCETTEPSGLAEGTVSLIPFIGLTSSVGASTLDRDAD